jgi:hypothetical protein
MDFVGTYRDDRETPDWIKTLNFHQKNLKKLLKLFKYVRDLAPHSEEDPSALYKEKSFAVEVISGLTQVDLHDMIAQLEDVLEINNPY